MVEERFVELLYIYIYMEKYLIIGIEISVFKLNLEWTNIVS